MSEFINPLPVVVVRIRVKSNNGLVLIRRRLRDGEGKLALPGGFQEDERWQDTAAREVLEEALVVIDPEQISLIDVETVEIGTGKPVNLIFCDAEIEDYKTFEQLTEEWHNSPQSGVELHEFLGLTFDQYGKFINEVSETLVITQPVETAFPAHTVKVRQFFGL